MEECTVIEWNTMNCIWEHCPDFSFENTLKGNQWEQDITVAWTIARYNGNLIQARWWLDITVAWTIVVTMKVMKVLDSGYRLKIEPKRSTLGSNVGVKKKTEKSQRWLVVFGLRREAIGMESLSEHEVFWEGQELSFRYVV